MPEFYRLGGALSPAVGPGAEVIAGRFEPFLRRLGAGLAQRLHAAAAQAWLKELRRLGAERLSPSRHGDLPAWLNALAGLPEIDPSVIRLDRPCVEVAGDLPPDARTRAALHHAFDALHPWRKGPFCLHGLMIDAEWRSDLKWARLAPHISPLDGRMVLDVGCGNGYYGYRALGAGAALVLGIDPTLRFVLQFLALDALIADPRLAVLPLADTDLPLADAVFDGRGEGPFDTVFSMGVLYHRRDADAHLSLLHRALRPGGQLVLETLILDGAPHNELRPAGRYARMRNVHAIPGVAVLESRVAAAGFRDIRVVAVDRTTTAEQRSTPWMRFESLDCCLDPVDPGLTVEGYPAPTRAVLLAERKSC